ncbi:hypothetical protein F8388_004986 [Cannabis sativa]|uniref:Thiaminase-2/PQQC domain-containing protein n=1 Tax=Cannabis sativa TaxID=3483 RepID=A0A7J6FYU2_CANSA|nr:hypothetical protein F8388_004986 [Cannabis sativa]
MIPTHLWRFSSASVPNLQIPPPLRLGPSSLLRLLYLSPDSSLLCPFFLSHSLSVRQPPSSPTVATTLSFFPIIFSLVFSSQTKIAIVGHDYIFVRAFVPFVASLIVKAWKESDDRSDMKVRLGGMDPMNDEREWFKKEAFKWGVQLFHPLLPHKPNQEILQRTNDVEHALRRHHEEEQRILRVRANKLSFVKRIETSEGLFTTVPLGPMVDIEAVENQMAPQVRKEATPFAAKLLDQLASSALSCPWRHGQPATALTHSPFPMPPSSK